MRTAFRALILVVKMAVIFNCTQFIRSSLTALCFPGRIPSMFQPGVDGSASFAQRGFCSLFFHGSQSQAHVDQTTVLDSIDVLTASAHDLQVALKAGTVTSVNLVNKYLDQIDSHNHRGMHLNAVISVTDRTDALREAEKRDLERKKGKKIGPLHGIPILVKDVFLSPSLNMETSCGSLALRGANGIHDAGAIERLLNSGMIIIGKTNLSELAGAKQSFATAGWSAKGGQTQSPYVRGGVLKNATFLGHSTPGGSSSGSAVGVAAGFAPLAIGTETDGSIVQPGTRAALYSMKPTVGSTDTSYCLGFSPPFDANGGFAKSAQDLAALMEMLMDKNLHVVFPTSPKGISIGFVNPNLWQPVDFIIEPNEAFTRQTFVAIKAAVAKLQHSGARVVENVPLITLDELTQDPEGVQAIEELMVHDLHQSINTFLKHFRGHSVANLNDLVSFNDKHSELEMPPDHPGQDLLVDAFNDQMTNEDYARKLKILRDKAVFSISRTMKEYRIDVILGPADARFSSIAASAGFPVATVPLGFAGFNGRAFGMHMIALAGQEKKILETMSVWEKLFPEARAAPPLLVNWHGD